MFGFQHVFATAMVLAAVDQLSDEDVEGKNKDASGSVPKSKPVAKSKSSASKPVAKPKKPKAAPKSAGSKAAAKEKVPKTKPSENEEEPEDKEMLMSGDEEIVPKKKPSAKATIEKAPKAKSKGLKRPAASRESTGKKFSVCKYMYKTGKWGFKIHGKEVFGVTGLQTACT